MVGGFHAQTLHTQRNEQMTEDQVAGNGDQEKTDKESLDQVKEIKTDEGEWEAFETGSGIWGKWGSLLLSANMGFCLKEFLVSVNHTL